MKLQITDAATKWFENEMNVSPAQKAAIRFYGKLYGRTKVHDGFSIALARELDPHNFGVKVEKVNIMNYKPKAKRVGRHAGFTSRRRKAIVKLTADSKEIEIFQGV